MAAARLAAWWSWEGADGWGVTRRRIGVERGVDMARVEGRVYGSQVDCEHVAAAAFRGVPLCVLLSRWFDLGGGGTHINKKQHALLAAWH